MNSLPPGSTAVGPGPRRRVDPARVTGRQLLAGLLWSVLVATASCVATFAALQAWAPAWDPQAVTVLLVAEAYLGVILGLTLAVGGPAGLRDRLALRPAPPREFAVAVAAWMAAAVLAALIYLIWGWITGSVGALARSVVEGASDAATLPTATTTVVVLILLRIGLLTGMAEELLFRGAIYGWLRLRLTPAPAIAITSVLFVLEHAFRPVLIPAVLCYAVAAGWVRHHSRSTLTTIVIHIITDLGFFAAALTLTWP